MPCYQKTYTVRQTPATSCSQIRTTGLGNNCSQIRTTGLGNGIHTERVIVGGNTLHNDRILLGGGNTYHTERVVVGGTGLTSHHVGNGLSLGHTGFHTTGYDIHTPSTVTVTERRVVGSTLAQPTVGYVSHSTSLAPLGFGGASSFSSGSSSASRSSYSSSSSSGGFSSSSGFSSSGRFL